jgi:tight adherence protein B
MRRLAVLALPALLAALAALPAGAAEPPVRLLEIGGVEFPDRAYVLTLPKRTRIGPGSVRVLENGEPVWNLSLTPAGAAGTRQFAVVLAIDASNSMRGRAIDAAMAAARAFAARRNANQQLAIVGFNRRPFVILPFTTDQRAIVRALARRPAHDEGTRLYEAIDLGLAMLRRARIATGSIVVLSDGADVGSRVTRDAVVRRAQAADVRLFTVGLRSRAFDARTLAAMAVGTSGSYSEAASPADLAPIFDELGYKLANEYVLRYRSLAGPGQEIRVTVTVEGMSGRATTGYRTPRLGLATPLPYRPAPLEGLVRSTVAMVAVGFFSAGLLAIALMALVRPRQNTVLRRLAGYVSVPLERGPKQPERSRRTLVSEKVLEGTERSLEKTRWWTSFQEELDLAEISTSAAQLAVVAVGLGLGLGALLTLLTGSPAGALVGVLVPVGVRAVVKGRVERKRRLFADQLPDNLDVLSSALRAGHSLVGALSVVVDDAPEPSKSEFRRVIADEQLGVPLEDALAVTVRRMKSGDLDQVALVATIQRDTGGNTAEVLDRVADTVRERAELRRLVRTLTAQGRMARWIVSLLPVVLLGAIMLINPGYMNPMFTNSTGRALLFVSALFIVSGSLVIKRIVNIKV